jgi:hypothetical protein
MRREIAAPLKIQRFPANSSTAAKKSLVEPERRTSGAKARHMLKRISGTTEVVPFPELCKARAPAREG